MSTWTKLSVVMGALIAILLWSGQEVYGQAGVEARILGVVKDETNAVVPGAEVTASNLETGLSKTVVAGDEGSFEIPALPIGPYSVTVTLPGFKTWRLEQVTLTAGQQLRISPTLEVGTVGEEITVMETVALIQTEKASVETAVTEKQIRDLPLNGRNPVELVQLAPGMRYLGEGGAEQGHAVQGLGNRDENTEFSVDGLTANSGMDERGIAIPNVDTVAEFNIQTANFSAELGRNPLQVQVVTKSGTNEFHGSLWEFHRNDALDARNTFAAGKPKLIRNQFGFAVGGPIISDRTFFFGSYEGIRIRREQIYNSFTIAPEMLEGDFSSLSQDIIDPLTGEPFLNNQIPEDRIVPSARFFYDWILLPNSPGQRFRAVAPVPEDHDEFTVRIDHQITDNQRIYGRYIFDEVQRTAPQYRPDIIQENGTDHDNFGINYNWSITPTTLLELGGNVLVSDNNFTSPSVGTTNLTSEAGIQGFSTEGRAAFVGPPNVSFSGYTGFSMPWGTPGRLWMNAGSGRVNLSLIRGDHSMSMGYDYSTRSTWGRHGSCCSRGVFGFNGQYTGDGFADYLLGLVASGSRNFPIQTFGMADSPYSGIYFQDNWRVSDTVTFNAGLRFDYWHEKSFVRGNGATFDVSLGKILAGEDESGQVDLTSQPVAPFLAAATSDLWIPASEAGAPGGLFEASGVISPRVGLAWRPSGNNDFVIRGGYGLFTSSFRGNASASSIVGPPYWTFETTGWSASELQRWETAWPADPQAFVTPSVQAPSWEVDPQMAHEWNVSVQKTLPGDTALTVSYVGNRMTDMITDQHHNAVPPGQYDDLQGSLPFPNLGNLLIYDNIGDSWYNSLQTKFERRFRDGASFLVSYAFSKHIEENGATLWDRPTPFSPEGYERGRSELDRTHILSASGIWEVPVGRGRPYANDLHPVADAILGGWQFSSIYNFTSGAPLTFGVPGATLGNGFGTRPNLVGDPERSDPSADRWFNQAALATPSQFVFGDSGIGILDGPGSHLLNVSLMKNFYFTEERFLQFRWEMFNMPNHVNLGNPVTTIGLGSTGQIFSAGDARQMQVGLKFIF